MLTRNISCVSVRGTKNGELEKKLSTIVVTGLGSVSNVIVS